MLALRHYSIFSKFADDCGSAAQESKLVEKNNSNSRQFLTFVVVRKNRSVEEVNIKQLEQRRQPKNSLIPAILDNILE